jgi:hypothetical protein
MLPLSLHKRRLRECLGRPVKPDIIRRLSRLPAFCNPVHGGDLQSRVRLYGPQPFQGISSPHPLVVSASLLGTVVCELGGLARTRKIAIGREVAMNDLFEKRVKAAAVAGWWTVLVAIGFVTLLWVVYLAVMSARPAWYLTMWGPEVDWTFVRTVWFWAVAILKFIVWLMALLALWLTLWSRQLRKSAGQG